MADEDTIDRITRERQERIEASRAEKYSPSDGRSGNPRPTSRRRMEQLQVSVRQSPPVTTPRPMVAAAPAPARPANTVEVVVVDNGEFKKGNFYIDGGLTAV